MFCCFRLRLVILVGVICLCGTLQIEFARAEMHLRPTLLLEQHYTDNYFRSEFNPIEMWITRISPGVQWEVYTDRSRLDLDYVFSYFWHNSPEEGIDESDLDYAGHDLYFFAGHRFTSRLTAGLVDEYILTREPASSDRFSNIVDRNKYWRNRLEPFITYDIAEKGEAKLAYRNEQLEWLERSPGEEDSSENRGILTLTYNLNETNHLDLEGQVWKRDYKGILSDYESYQGKLIFRHEFTTFLKGQAGAGYHSRNFEKPSLEDADEPVFHLSLQGDTELTKVNLFFERNLVDFTTGDAYFTATRFNGYVEHIFLDALRPYLGGYYQFSDYLNSNREDDTYNIHAGLGYRFLNDIFELSLENMFEAVVVVTAKMKNRLERIKLRDKLSEKEITDRMSKQIPIEDKVQWADHLIENDGTLEQLEVKTKKLFHKLKNPTRKKA